MPRSFWLDPLFIFRDSQRSILAHMLNWIPCSHHDGIFFVRMGVLVKHSLGICQKGSNVFWYVNSLWPIYFIWYHCPDSKVHGANMGHIWGRQDPGGPHVDPMNFAIWVIYHRSAHILRHFQCYWSWYQPWQCISRYFHMTGLFTMSQCANESIHPIRLNN